MSKTFKIAIDGPVAAGKGTTAKILAERLGFLYVDTGAMYRALALSIYREGIDWEEEEKICEFISSAEPSIMLRVPEGDERDGRLCTVFLDEEDVSWKIRTENISKGVAKITKYKCVRDYATPLQREIAQENDVVMEGRDITTAVLPDADLKIYMDADPRVRAKRRHAELSGRGEDVSFSEVYDELMERDKRDMSRDLNPLKVSPDAWVLDTTTITVDETADLMVKRVSEIRGE